MQSRFGSNWIRGLFLAGSFYFKNQKFRTLNMKRIIALYLSLALGLCLSPSTSNAQRELLDGLLDREEPSFYASILPTEEDGVIHLAIHFTHSKINTLEASFWIADHGANLLSEGNKRMARGLQTIGNRQQDTIVIHGLADRHFYSIGVDYRNASAINRKFSSKVVQEGYFYTFPRKDKLSDSTPAQPQAAPSPAVPEPASPPALSSGKPATGPCHTPNLFVKVEPAGFCGAENRPAVSIQCDNCVGRNWEFSVEIRQEYGSWEPVRRDGMRQPAAGLGIRTEPLCLLAPGRYYLQVLAWGEHCENPVIYNLGPAITISGNAPPATVAPKAGTLPLAAVPDTCNVLSEAQLQGNVIKGALLLETGSACAAWNPVARISYVNPGHRNIELDDMPLSPGQLAPFNIQLDQRDLSRGIHTIQVKVAGHSAELNQPIPLYSFWLRADEGKNGELSLANYRPSEPVRYNQGWQKDPEPANMATKGGVIAPPSRFDEEEPMLEDSFQEVQVKATDPNCPQIQNLQLVYSPTQPDRPLYISWLSPRCCQEEGCEYSVWAGKTPGQLQLLVKGRKPGATVTEILQSLETDNQYFEVVVRTPNGNRKAAYIAGEGPKYGIEAILDYQDQFTPQSSDAIVGIKEQAPQETAAAIKPVIGGELAVRSGALAETLTAAPFYEQPKLPISRFESCRIFRETHIIANKPIRTGEQVMIEYAFQDKSYRYTLYHLPENGSEWVLAPGTKELQASPAFQFVAQSFHSGKYLILASRPDGSWGCLSAPMENALELKVMP
jgi:hypothetical protein